MVVPWVDGDVGGKAAPEGWGMPPHETAPTRKKHTLESTAGGRVSSQRKKGKLSSVSESKSSSHRTEVGKTLSVAFGFPVRFWKDSAM